MACRCCRCHLRCVSWPNSGWPDNGRCSQCVRVQLRPTVHPTPRPTLGAPPWVRRPATRKIPQLCHVPSDGSWSIFLVAGRHAWWGGVPGVALGAALGTAAPWHTNRARKASHYLAGQRGACSVGHAVGCMPKYLNWASHCRAGWRAWGGACGVGRGIGRMPKYLNYEYLLVCWATTTIRWKL